MCTQEKNKMHRPVSLHIVFKSRTSLRVHGVLHSRKTAHSLG
jgi:hypothetical protein